MGPLVTTNSRATGLGSAISAGSEAPVRKWVSPLALGSPNSLCREGLRRSQSISSTLLPVWAKVIAVLHAEVVLPSLADALVKCISRGAPSLVAKISEVRKDR